MQNKAEVSPVFADVNRIAAGIAAAAATGALAQIIELISHYLVGPSRGLLPEPQWLDQVLGMAVGAAVVGSPCSILLMFVTRARHAPWTSLLVLPLGMAIGYECLSTPLFRIPALESLSTLFGPLPFLAVTVAGPVIGGLAASWLVRPFGRRNSMR